MKSSVSKNVEPTPKGERPKEPKSMRLNIKDWSRGDKLAALGIVVTVIVAVIAVANPEVRQFLRLERPVDRVAAPVFPVAPVPNVSHKLIARTGVDAATLQKQDRVLPIGVSENGKTLAEIPPNTLSYVEANALTEENPWPITVRRDGFPDDFELHKLDHGELLVVGYVGPETFEHLREGVSEGKDITVFSDAFAEASNVVEFPLHEITCKRNRQLRIKTRAGKIHFIEALDCVAN